tara:strand:+ start:897 stop:1028 length:132 start_codon:yes stop_codon:yes gene_type:complete
MINKKRRGSARPIFFFEGWDDCIAILYCATKIYKKIENPKSPN